MNVRRIRLPSGAVAWMIETRHAGRRIRRQYPTRGKARRAAADLARGLAEIGAAALELSAADRFDAAEARRILPPGVRLADAAREYAERHARPALTVAEAAAGLIRAKVDARRRPRTILELRTVLGLFEKTHGGRQLADVTTAQVGAWLAAWHGQTAANRRRVLHSLFAYWIRKGAIDRNPAAEIDKPAVADSLPGILRADDAARLLHAAEARDVPALAVALFAGIRTAELEALRWCDIEAGQLVIVPEVAKTRRARLVEIGPPLAEWLDAYRPAAPDPAAPIAPAYWRARLAALAKRERIALPHNATRHTFASMALAAGRDPAEVSRIMGNSTGILAGHYRNGLVPKAEAARFWQIRPGVEAPAEQPGTVAAG